MSRSSPPEVFLWKGFLKKCRSNFIEITIGHGYSPVNLQHIFRAPFPKNTSGGLLLNVRDVVLVSLFRSSHKRVLKNFSKFTAKHLRRSLLFNKVAGLNFIFRPAILFKMKLRHRCFPVNFEKSLRAPFLQNTSGRLLAFVDFKLIQQVNLVFLVLILNK